jgi:hypothetical protein
MRFLLLAMLVAVLLAATGWFSHASAQAKRPMTGVSAAATERAAVDLRQGMTLEEVQQLLGKPWRTAMTGSGPVGAPSLRWTYTWIASSSASDRNLNIDFTAKAPEQQWVVNGWNWSSY